MLSFQGRIEMKYRKMLPNFAEVIIDGFVVNPERERERECSDILALLDR